MSYEWEDNEDQAIGRATRLRLWLGRRARNSLRYLFVAVALLAAWNFLAPFASMPLWAPYMEVLPPITAPTEGSSIINATHVVVMLVAAAIGMRV
jgi:hypothetical protein